MVTRLEQITVPDIEYSGLYFPQIFANLRRINRINAPEITNEDSRELFIQLEKAFSLMAHYNNVLLDIVANEVFLKTARLPESVKLALQLLNFNLLPASPAEVDILAELVRSYTSGVTLLPANRKVATKRSPEIPEIVYENSEDLTTKARTDEISEAYSLSQTKTGVCYAYSPYPDILYWTSGNTWVTADINNYIRITNSTLANNTEDLRITELLDETAPGSGIFNQVRVDGGSFISETGLTFELSEVSQNYASDYAAGIGAALFPGVPSNIDINDKFYFGHSDIMYDRFDITFATPASGIESVIEFYDEDEIYINPDSVSVVAGPLLEFDVTSLLGSYNAAGALVKVVYLPTGAETNIYSIWDASTNKIQLSSYLGQSDPSTVATDYYLFCNWRPLEALNDTTATTVVGPPPEYYHFESNGYMDYTLPQSQDDNWQMFSLYDKNGSETKTGYMLRYRVISVSTPTAPIPLSMNFNNGSHYVLYTATQGKTVEDSPLGSSDGTAYQEFTLTQSPYVYDSLVLYVDEGGGDILWTRVKSLRSSKSYDRHYVLDLQSDGTAIVKFGDGTNGKIPPLGASNISGTYRIGGDYDGNVGINTVTVNSDGSGVFKNVTNPRAAKYWIEADWNSQTALEKVKEDGPATISTMYRATSASDCEVLARNFRTIDGVRPVRRAKAYEESFGPKTMELVVVGAGGASVSADNKTEIEEYFNGGDTYDGVFVVNHELTVSNYVPKLIGISCTVKAWPVVTETRVIQALSGLLNPTAVELDRFTWTWRFGEEVPLSRIIAEIFNISLGNVFKVEITSPSEDVLLGTLELPMFDASTTNIVIESP